MASQHQVNEPVSDLSKAIELPFSSKFTSLTDRGQCSFYDNVASGYPLNSVTGGQIALHPMQQTSAHKCTENSGFVALSSKANDSAVCVSSFTKVDLPLPSKLQLESVSEAGHGLQTESLELARAQLSPELDSPEALPEQCEIEFPKNQDFQPQAESGINSESENIATWIFDSLGIQNWTALVPMFTQPPQAGAAGPPQ